ncbi:hypothetical protein, partial [Saccharophagus degradans]
MKNIKYLMFLGIMFYSCSDGDNDTTEKQNQSPSIVSTLTHPSDNLLCITNVLDFKWEASI